MEGFKAFYSVDEVTQRRVTRMTFDGVECASFSLHGQVAKRYVGLSLIQADLEDALSWIRGAYALSKRTLDAPPATQLVTEPDDESRTCKALFYASIITYGKCFQNAEDEAERGRGRLTKLQREHHVAAEFQPCHDRISGYRNHLVAHAVDPTDNGEIVIALHPTHDAYHLHSNLTRLNFEDDRLPLPDGTHPPTFERLIEHVLGNVVEAMKAIEQRRLNDEAAQAVAEYYRERRALGLPIRPVPPSHGENHGDN
jgi:hypothetical protein